MEQVHHFIWEISEISSHWKTKGHITKPRDHLLCNDCMHLTLTSASQLLVGALENPHSQPQYPGIDMITPASFFLLLHLHVLSYITFKIRKEKRKEKLSYTIGMYTGLRAELIATFCKLLIQQLLIPRLSAVMSLYIWCGNRWTRLLVFSSCSEWFGWDKQNQSLDQLGTILKAPEGLKKKNMTTLPLAMNVYASTPNSMLERSFPWLGTTVCIYRRCTGLT